MLAIAEVLSAGQATLIVATRLAPVLLLSPILNSFRVPTSARLIVLLTISYAIAQGSLLQELAGLPDIDLLAICLAEVVIGMTLALGVHATFAAFSIAGKIIDIQSGLAIASVIDPVTKTSAGTIAQILSISALALFFYSDVHLDLLRVFAASFDFVPPGGALEGYILISMVERASLMFTYAVGLAAPILLALLLIDLAIAITSRSMPQINVLVLATPIKSVAAIALLSLTCRFWTAGIGSPLRIFESYMPR